MARHIPKSSSPSALTSPEIVVVGRVSAAITQLTILDDHWTRTAISVTRGDPGNNVDELGEVVSTIDALLDSSREDFARIASIFRAHASQMRTAYEHFATGKGTGGNALTSVGQSAFRSLVDQHGGGDIVTMAAEAGWPIPSASHRKSAPFLRSTEGQGQQTVGR